LPVENLIFMDNVMDKVMDSRPVMLAGSDEHAGLSR